MDARDEAPQADSQETSGPSDPVTMIRSEEQVRIRLESLPVERVRLERYIVSEERVITVTVQREEVRLVREPILPGEQEQARLAQTLQEDADHMLLREEQVTITKTVVPVERVTLVKRSVVVDEDVSLERRLEQVDVSRHGALNEVREAP